MQTEQDSRISLARNPSKIMCHDSGASKSFQRFFTSLENDMYRTSAILRERGFNRSGYLLEEAIQRSSKLMSSEVLDSSVLSDSAEEGNSDVSESFSAAAPSLDSLLAYLASRSAMGSR